MSERFLDLDSSRFCEHQEETAGPAKAFLVGAGPGDPGLITRRGAEILGIADVVLYDRLVADSILHQFYSDKKTRTTNIPDQIYFILKSP